MSDPFVIVEAPIPLPEGIESIDPADAFSQLLVRCGALERMLEAEKLEAQQEQRTLLIGMLEVADALDRVLQQFGTIRSDSEPALERQHRNLAATRRLLSQKLEQVGVTPIITMGQILDPIVADVDGYREDSNLPDETVIYEIQRGYHWRGDILRRAKVLVSQAS